MSEIRRRLKVAWLVLLGRGVTYNMDLTHMPTEGFLISYNENAKNYIMNCTIEVSK